MTLQIIQLRHKISLMMRGYCHTVVEVRTSQCQRKSGWKVHMLPRFGNKSDFCAGGGARPNFNVPETPPQKVEEEYSALTMELLQAELI